MIHLAIKFATTALIVVLVSELAKRLDARRRHSRLDPYGVRSGDDLDRPTLLRLGIGFWWSLAAGITATALAYWGSIQLMTWFRG